jgi:hypothetical protein
MSSRKLRHYFEAFKVRVTSDRGLGELFRNPEASVRICNTLNLGGIKISFLVSTKFRCYPLFSLIFFLFFFLNSGELFCFIYIYKSSKIKP